MRRHHGASAAVGLLALFVAIVDARGQSSCTTSADCNDGTECTVDTCTSTGTCVFQPVDCNDGTACTDDSCDPVTGQCIQVENGSCTENPKTLNYWQRVCRGNGNLQDAITASDVTFVRANSCGFPYYIHSTDDICWLLTENRSYNCFTAEQELMALALNLSHHRVSFTDGIDSRCTDYHIVAHAFSEADQILCSDRIVSGRGQGDPGCDRALCECREINQGVALHVHGLVVSNLANGAVRLAWIPPVANANALSATPSRYRVWRAAEASGPFVQIGEVAQTTFDDTAAVGDHLVYDVTPVW